MRHHRLLVLLLGFAVAGCSKDDAAPAEQIRDHQTDEAQRERSREREALVKAARERADKLHTKVGELDKLLADAEQELAAAKTDAERKAAEAKLRDLRAQQHGDGKPPEPNGSGSGKTIDLKCQDQPLGCK